MSTVWNTYRIEDIADKITIGPFGSRMKSDAYVESGVPVIRGTNLTGSKKFSGDWVFISEQLAKQLENCCVSNGDLVFPHRGSIGEVGLVDNQFHQYMMSSSLMKLRCNPNIADSEFIYYFFKSHQGRYELLKNASQVGTPGIGQPLTSLKNIEIKLPSLGEQRKIAKILSDLDDKIHINNQINQTLESIAQALFKSWFVDFDPVRAKIAAKQEGKDPELAAMCAISGKSEVELQQMAEDDLAELRATASLFPDELVESELGEVPKGWFKTDLSILADLNVQSWTKKNCPEKVTYVDLSNTKWGVIQQTEEFIFEKAPSRARRVLKIGDTIVGTVRPANGSYAFIQRENLTGSTGFAVLSPKHKNYAEFIYIVATDKENIKRLAHLADGGAYPAVSYDTVLNTPCILPIENKDGVLNLFHKNVKEFYLLSASKFEENNILASIRDTLLPKLLSGELDVSCVQDEVA
ncbi:TPA: restriction endonuclease subunit S [Acinetobacter baumannii]|nr:restriction endonuclease subunit S [Acinetobacter baumannii]